MASPSVKEARRKGELSLSQTNEIVKLKKEEQDLAIEHIKELPVREIKKFVKMAKEEGVQEAISSTPHLPYQKEFLEIDAGVKKLIKKIKQLDLEGIEMESFPIEIQRLLNELVKLSTGKYDLHPSAEEREADSLQ